MYLVDTSAWVLHFSKKDPFDLRTVCVPAQRILCLPVYQEILQGIGDESAYRNIRDIIGAADFVEDPLTRTIYLEAVQLLRTSRKQGLTIRSSADCLIAACAIRHNLIVLHRDRDYSAIASVSPLRHEAV